MGNAVGIVVVVPTAKKKGGATKAAINRNFGKDKIRRVILKYSYVKKKTRKKEMRAFFRQGAAGAFYYIDIKKLFFPFGFLIIIAHIKGEQAKKVFLPLT